MYWNVLQTYVWLSRYLSKHAYNMLIDMVQVIVKIVVFGILVGVNGYTVGVNGYAICRNRLRTRETDSSSTIIVASYAVRRNRLH